MKKAFCVIIIFVMIISSSAFSFADSDTSNRVSDLKIWMMQNDYLFPQEMILRSQELIIREKK